MNHRIRFFLFLVATFLGITGNLSFGQQKQEGNEGDQYSVTFTVIHKAGDEFLEFDTIRYRNDFGNTYSVYTLKYFISNIILTNSDGKLLLLKNTQYIDARNSKTTTFHSDYPSPAGTYTQLSFLIGLDNNTNTSGKFPNPPENRMEWPETMGGGYHYMKIEGKILAPEDDLNFQAHSGKLNSTPYFIRIVLPLTNLNIENQDVNIQISMDVNEWWKHPHILDLRDITAIMDNSQVQKQLMENGADVFTIVSVK